MPQRLTQNYDRFLLGKPLSDRTITKYQKLGYYGSTWQAQLASRDVKREKLKKERLKHHTTRKELLEAY